MHVDVVPSQRADDAGWRTHPEHSWHKPALVWPSTVGLDRGEPSRKRTEPSRSRTKPEANRTGSDPSRERTGPNATSMSRWAVACASLRAVYDSKSIALSGTTVGHKLSV